jgi:hypothetical protein
MFAQMSGTAPSSDVPGPPTGRSIAAPSAERKPRLLIMTPDFPPAQGGIQVLAHRLAAGIEGFEIEVLAPDSPGAVRFDARGDIAVRRVGGARLPGALRNVPLRVDLARHVNRPGTKGPTAGQNFLFDPARDEIRPLSDSELFRQIPFSYRICRVYSETHEHDATLAAALDSLVGGSTVDDTTNM